MTTWKALNNQAPEYINNLIQIRQQPDCNLYGNDKLQLIVPSTRNNNKMADRAFSNAAPNLWNSIPDEVKTCNSLETFKRNLKKHLF